MDYQDFLIAHLKRTMSHARGSAQCRSHCGEDTNQYLNHHFPSFFLHNYEL